MKVLNYICNPTMMLLLRCCTYTCIQSYILNLEIFITSPEAVGSFNYNPNAVKIHQKL